MSVAPGNLATAPRLPLKEHNENYIVMEKNSKLIDTPTVHRESYTDRITTPPGSIMGSKKSHIRVETPIGKMNEGSDVATAPKSVLLSPAFSSPRQRKDIFMNNEENTSNIDISMSSVSLSFLSDENVGTKQMKKKKKTRKQLKEQSFDFDSDHKPPYSYATLIGMSILSNYERKLTLSQIYLWISDTFKYYKRDEVGWQNSIRHNLSLNKAFIKGEKSRDGKGHFWCIKEGCEEQFLKTRSMMKNSYNETMGNIYSSLKGGNDQRSINSIPSSPNASGLQHDDQNYSRKRVSSEIDEAADYANEDDDEDGLGHAFTISANKKQKLTYNDNTSIPTIESHLESTPYKARTLTTPLISSTPQFVILESPNKPLLAGKNLAYTSSFSCSSNLELSPIRPTETGPLLEPLTPSNNIYSQIQNGAQSSQQKSVASSHITFGHQPYHLQRTPKSNLIRTPLKLLRTPQTSSIMKKLWNSPSYLEEFYYSPLVGSSTSLLNSYDDDDMIMRNLELQHLPIGLKRQQIFDLTHKTSSNLNKNEASPSQITLSTRNHKIASSSTDVDE